MSILKNAKLSIYKGLYTKKKNEDLQYIARFKANSKTFTKIIGYKSEGITLDEAYKIKLNLENEHKIKASINNTHQYEFCLLFKDFIDFRSPYLSKNTNKNYRSHFNKYFSVDFNQKDLRNISQIDNYKGLRTSKYTINPKVRKYENGHFKTSLS